MYQETDAEQLRVFLPSPGLGDAAWTRAAVCPPSSGCLNAASRHPDPSLFKGTLSIKAHPNSGPHCEILEISVKVSQGHAFSMLFNGKESWGRKVGMRSGNLNRELQQQTLPECSEEGVSGLQICGRLENI
uniref:Uncharacterized protein n=1 Tax=Aquila chrysaetos chrysaetos TaxID=223781 RepID=A0A663FFH2_AQUCH